MTDLLISTVLTGLAVTYLVEFLDVFTYTLFAKDALNKFLALPLSFLGVWALNPIAITMLVIVPASTFVSVALSKYLNKPVVINQPPRLPRL